MTTSTNGNGNLIDEFEEAFQQCLGLFTREYNTGNAVNLYNENDAKSDTEQTTMRFMDLARQVEGFFLQKRFLLSALKPELIGKEDVSELKAELIRKDELIKKNYEKIYMWQNLLSEMQFWVRSEEPDTSNPVHGFNVNNTGMMQPQPQPQMIPPQRPQQMGQHMQPNPQAPVPSSAPVPMAMGGMPPQNAIPQHNMAMAQNGLPGRAPAFPVNNTPLAFLEKTTSNIGIADRRS